MLFNHKDKHLLLMSNSLEVQKTEEATFYMYPYTAKLQHRWKIHRTQICRSMHMGPTTPTCFKGLNTPVFGGPLNSYLNLERLENLSPLKRNKRQKQNCIPGFQSVKGKEGSN